MRKRCTGSARCPVNLLTALCHSAPPPGITQEPALFPGEPGSRAIVPGTCGDGSPALCRSTPFLAG